MRKTSLCAAAVLAAVMATPSLGVIIITEIHYNPNGGESAAQEWIEIYNTSNATVDLSGWSWGDSQDNQFTGPFPAGTVIGPKQAAVLSFLEASVFHQIWGEGILVIQTDTAISLSNSASPTNELVVIRDADLNIVDEVNYEAGSNGWPPSVNFASIYLLPSAINAAANDIGSNWATSTAGVHGAYDALIIHPGIINATRTDVASPGIVVVDAGGPDLILGDFNFDGLLDAGDIDNFTAALLESEPFEQFISDFGSDFAAQYGTELTAELVVSLGDFDANGIFDAGDIDGFVDAVLNSGRPGASVIPEPAALGLLAPMGVLLTRRRR